MSHQCRSTQCVLSLNFSLIGFSCRSELATSVEKNRESLQSLTDNQQPITNSHKKCYTFRQIIFFITGNPKIKHQRTLTATGFSKVTRVH